MNIPITEHRQNYAFFMRFANIRGIFLRKSDFYLQFWIFCSIFASCIIVHMDNRHNILGREGEEMAAQLLQQKGYTILERNWSIGDLETDIIAQTDETIVFVEVKTRGVNDYKNPEDYVDRQRQIRLTAGAQAYIKHNKLDNPWRFDVISIVMKAGEPEIVHFEDAFLPVLKTVTKNKYSGQERWKQSHRSTRRKGLGR